MNRAHRRLRSLAASARRARAGAFTLIEMMVVVIIVAILAAIALPSMLAGMRNKSAYESSNEIALLVRLAKARAMGLGVAQVLEFKSNGVSDRGRVHLYEARIATVGTTSCQGWAAAGPTLPATTPGAATPTAAFVDFRLVDGKTDATKESALLLNGAAAGNLGYLCYTPKGTPYYSATLAGLANAAIFTGTYEMDVTDKPGGVKAGLVRKILIPAGAAPRIRSVP
jgi:prepilin-type N-terminal cleavage/methylation domain-containing protein